MTVFKVIGAVRSSPFFLYFILLAVVGGGLWRARKTGGDFTAYEKWAEVSTTGQILDLGGDVESPMGVPLTQWAHGAGFIFSIPRLLAGSELDLRESALTVGWLGAVVFWASIIGLLHHLSGGRALWVLLGVGLAYTATHGGFYTRTYGLESLSLGCMAALGTLTVVPLKSRWLAVVGASAAAGLLVILRAQLAPYALLATAAVAWRQGGFPPAGSKVALRRWQGAAPVALGIAIVASAMVQVGLVNRWMTGSALRSPYQFGDDRYSSLALSSPEFAAVLFHPWHGWLTYHPLYAAGLAALVLCAFRASTARTRILLCLLTASIAAHLYIHAAWYCWWLGTGTFGMRGLAVVCVPAIAAMVACLRDRPRLQSWSLAPGLAAALWSFLLLWRELSNLTTWSALLSAQEETLQTLAFPLAAGALTAAATLCIPRKWLTTGSRVDAWCVAAVSFLGSLMALDLVGRFESESPLMQSLVASTGAILAGGAGFWACRVTSSGVAVDRATTWIAPTIACTLLAVLTVASVSFARVGIRTERFIAEQPGVEPGFVYQSAAYLPEIQASSNEYGMVDGFDLKKQRLKDWLARAERKKPMHPRRGSAR